MRSVALIQQAGEQPQQRLGITGPFSVEVPSGDGKLIRIAAVEAAMPQLLTRETFTVEHEESAVGKILPAMKVDWDRVPDDPAIQAMVKEFEASHGGLPTAIVTVTPAVAEAFPRLKSMVGERVAWVSGYIHGDNRIAQRVAERVRDGSLNSFSLNGVKFKARRMEWCDPAGCRMVDEIPDGGLDLETVTLCSDRGDQGVFGTTRAQNPGAALAVVQQARTEEEAVGPVPQTATERVIISHGRANDSGTVQAADDGPLGKQGCMARATLAALASVSPDTARLQAAARMEALVAEALLQAAEGWHGTAWRDLAREALNGQPELVRQPLKARGLTFGTFDECKAWADRHGLKDPGAFCGALEQETKEASPTSPTAPAREVELQQLSEATGVPGPVLQWLLQGDEFPGGFEGCVERMRKRGDVKDPDALCAEIGRRAGKIPAAETPGENRNRQDANGPSVAEARSMTPAVAKVEPAKQATTPSAAPAQPAAVKQDDVGQPGGAAPNQQEMLVEIMRRLEALEAKAGMTGGPPAPAGEAQAGAAPPAPAAPVNQASPAQPPAAPSPQAPQVQQAAPTVDAKALGEQVAQALLPQFDQRIDARLAQAGITVPKPASVPAQVAQARIQQAAGAPSGGSTPIPAAPGGDGQGSGLDGELERLQQAADLGTDPRAFARGLKLINGGGA